MHYTSKPSSTVQPAGCNTSLKAVPRTKGLRPSVAAVVVVVGGVRRRRGRRLVVVVVVVAHEVLGGDDPHSFGGTAQLPKRFPVHSRARTSEQSWGARLAASSLKLWLQPYTINSYRA